MRYQVVKNPRWNWNVRGEWIVADILIGCAVYSCMIKDDADITCHALNVLN